MGLTTKQEKKFKPIFEEYIRLYEHFNFSGKEELVLEDPNGVSAIEAFFEKESNGRDIPTFEPELLRKVLKAKGSINLFIQLYAEDRASGLLPGIEFSLRVCDKNHIQSLSKGEYEELEKNTFEYMMKLPIWFITAVENSKYKYYKKWF